MHLKTLNGNVAIGFLSMIFLQKEGVSASSRLEEVKKSLSIDSVAMFSDSTPDDDETGAALRLRCCYDYLRAEIRRLGNSLNKAFPKKLELCVKWRMTLLEFAGWLQLYSETCQTGGWSCREEQSQVVSRIKATKKNSLQLTCEVREELMGCERIYEKIGRFRVFRSVNNNDILEIQDRGSADKQWKTYGRFEPRATRGLNTLLEAYIEKTEDRWCRMRDGWRQAFLVRNKQAEDEDAGNANEFYNEQIAVAQHQGVVVRTKTPDGAHHLLLWCWSKKILVRTIWNIKSQLRVM